MGLSSLIPFTFLYFSYKDDPPYVKLEGLLQSIADENKIKNDAPFDWEENFVQVLHEEEHEPQPKSSIESDHPAA